MIIGTLAMGKVHYNDKRRKCHKLNVLSSSLVFLDIFSRSQRSIFLMCQHNFVCFFLHNTFLGLIVTSGKLFKVHKFYSNHRTSFTFVLFSTEEYTKSKSVDSHDFSCCFSSSSFFMLRSILRNANRHVAVFFQLISRIPHDNVKRKFLSSFSNIFDRPGKF